MRHCSDTRPLRQRVRSRASTTMRRNCKNTSLQWQCCKLLNASSSKDLPGRNQPVPAGISRGSEEPAALRAAQNNMRTGSAKNGGCHHQDRIGSGVKLDFLTRFWTLDHKFRHQLPHQLFHGGGRFCQDPDFLSLLDISNLFKPAQRVQTNLVHSSYRKYCLHSLCWRYFLYGWSSFRFGRAVARRTIFPFAL
jgi:hypothetical protein